MMKLFVLMLFSFSALGATFIDDGAVTPLKLSGPALGSFDSKNGSLSATNPSNTLVISLKQNDGTTDPTSRNPIRTSFRSATATSGAIQNIDFITSASITIPATASLGFVNSSVSSVKALIYVYMIQDTTNEICVSDSSFDDSELISATAISGAATTSKTLYCPSSHTNRPVKLFGSVKASWYSASGWTSLVKVNKIGIETSLGPSKSFLNYCTMVNAGNIYTNSTSYVDGTNGPVQCSITVSGNRPVLVGLSLENQSGDGAITTGLVASTSINGYIRILRDSTQIGSSYFGIQATGATSTAANAIGSFTVLDFPSPGTKTYKIQIKSGNSAATIYLNYGRLWALEL